MKMAVPVAVVTGSNKGLGFTIVKELCAKYNGVVYLTARDETRGLEAVEKLNALGYKPLFRQLDVGDKESIINFANFIKNKHGGLDVLVNNAGILEWNEIYPSYEAAKRTIDINYKSLLVIEEFLYPLLRDNARIVNISSAGAHLSNIRNKFMLNKLTKRNLEAADINEFVDNYLKSVQNGTFDKNDFADDGKHAEYRVSKIALTALTMIQQRKYNSRNISINAFHPGHMKTDMAHGKGQIDPEEATQNVLYLIQDASPNLKGNFMWCDRKIMDWYDVRGDYYYKHQG